MPSSPRRLRSASKLAAGSSSKNDTGASSSNTSMDRATGASLSNALTSAALPPSSIQVIKPGSRLLGLRGTELTLLRQKQRKLRTQAISTLASLPNDSPQLRTALEASLIFAQAEAGSAVCVDSAGWVLTCAHCIAETEEEYRDSGAAPRWLLSYTGLAVRVECRVWDFQRDLALLQITAVEVESGPVAAFAFLCPAAHAPAPKTRVVCIGQPGQDDLESTSARRTNYPFIFVSSGIFRGLVPGVDPHDNAEIGTLMHDAWTYWGHSGAPLIHAAEGSLVGLHSSWDDETGMRHGVPHTAIVAFLQLHLNA
ncbi:AT hook domain-containing protein family protein [Mycena olivaceomarginata]|nr:AT hook domain-containing protein family protein [Mycena olivaceomarginata]